MFCEKCGAPIADGAKFCEKCGWQVPTGEAAPVQATVEAEAPKAEAPKAEAPKAEAVKPQNTVGGQKKIKLPVVIAVAAVLVVCLFLIFGRSGGSAAGDEFNFFYSTEEEGTIVLFNGKNVGLIDGRVNDISYNLDHDVAYCLVSVSGNKGYELYKVTEKEIKDIAEEVSAYYVSLSGDGVAYVDYDKVLYLVDKKGNPKEVVDDYEGGSVAISPDGKTILYSYENRLCMYNGKVTELEKNLVPVAVANSGKYIYGYKDGNLYSVDKKGDKEKIGSMSNYSVILNKDYSEIIFSSDGTIYRSVKCGEKQKVCSGSYVTFVYPVSVNSYTSGSYTNFNVRVYDVKNYTKSIMNNGYGDYLYITDKWETEKRASGSYNFVNVDGKTTYYIKGESLYKGHVGDDENEKIAKDVTQFVVSPDGKYVYYVDDEQELKSLKSGKEYKDIAEDVQSIAMTQKGVCLYIEDSGYNDKVGTYLGTLCYAKSGKKGADVAEDVAYVTAGNKCVYFQGISDDDDDYMAIYTGNGTEKFEFLTNVRKFR